MDRWSNPRWWPTSTEHADQLRGIVRSGRRGHAAKPIDQAIALANDTPYGLSAGIFTENIIWALRFAREVDSGNLHINWGPPGGRPDALRRLKDSGLGKEGPKYAVEEMTELKTVVIHGLA